jgi:tetratricopeptide (TPR) repeat protein
MPSRKYRLETLGTVMLKGPDVSIRAADHRQQRRRLALLTALATAGEKGMSRDQLLLLFWPDSTQKKAKHSLDQLLYAIRQSLDESIFLGTNPIRLNADTITSDVGDFGAAMSNGNYAEAARLYQGPFLEGFYLSDTREFEEWADNQRSRLEKLYEKAQTHVAAQPVTTEERAPQAPAPVPHNRRRPLTLAVVGAGLFTILAAGGAAIYKREEAAPIKHGTSNLAAYDLYVHGKDQIMMRNDSLAQIALANFQQAARLDPEFAGAQAGIATMYTRLAMSARPVLPRTELKNRALDAAQRAIALDESVAEAHTAAGLIYSYFFIDPRVAVRELERAIELDPSEPFAHEYLAVSYVFLGQRDKGMQTIRDGIARDPLSPTMRATLALYHYLDGRCDLALPILDSLLMMKPPLLRVTPTKALCLASGKRWLEAAALLHPGADTSAVPNGYLGFFLANGGERKRAIAIREKLRSTVRLNDTKHFEISIVSYALGDDDDAFAELTKSVDSGWLPAEVFGPLFNGFTHDPRFAAMLRQHGLPTHYYR